MTLTDINPYIRYAAKTKLEQNKGVHKAKDHHLFFINEGNEKIKIDNKIYPLKTNSIIIIPAGTPYEFLIIKHIVFTSLNFDYSQIRSDKTSPFFPVHIDKFDENDILKNEFFTDYSILNEPIFLSEAYFAVVPLNHILTKHIFTDKNADIRASILLKSLIIDIVEASLYPVKENEKIKSAIEFIQNNYYLDISNEDISNHVGLHPYYLNRIFLKQTDKTLHKYLITHRIKSAELLLLSTNDTIENISHKVGFNSSLIFIKNFKQINSSTPTEFRRKNKKLI